MNRKYGSPNIWAWMLIYPHKKLKRNLHSDSRSPYGGCGFFVSTESYLFAYIPLNSNGVHLCYLVNYVKKSHGFLFWQMTDKPQPRCRSPPSPFDFKHFKKSNGGKNHEGQA